ncbi:hypothetical protein MTO96_018902 [Rhipicephalus appendiculatus]
MAAALWKQARVGMLTRPLEEITSSPTLTYTHAKRTLVQAHRHLGEILPAPGGTPIDTCLAAIHLAQEVLRCQGREGNEQRGLAKLPHHGANKGCTPELRRRARLQPYSLGRPCLCAPARMTSVGGRTWPLPASPHAGGHAVLVVRVAAHEPAVALARMPPVAAAGRQTEAGKAHLAVAVDVVVRRPVTWAAQARKRNRPAWSATGQGVRRVEKLSTRGGNVRFDMRIEPVPWCMSE